MGDEAMFDDPEEETSGGKMLMGKRGKDKKGYKPF